MPEPSPRITSVYAYVAEGKRLLATVSTPTEYDWQWAVGSWFIALDELIAATMSDEFRSDYLLEKIGVTRLRPDVRLRLIVEWLELALRRNHS